MPEAGRAPEEPQGEFRPTGPPADDFSQGPVPAGYDQRLTDPDEV